MQQALIFLAVLFLGGTTSFANPSESPTVETIVVDEMLILSENFPTEMSETDATQPEDEDEIETPSTHVPHLMSAALDLEATEGESVAFPCNVDDLGDFVLLWTLVRDKKTQVLFAGPLKILRDDRLRLNGTSLHVKDVQSNYSGEYICQIGTNPPTELKHMLDVLYPPSIEPYPKEAFLTAKEGESVTLTCHATGNPPPTIAWKHAGRHYESVQESSYVINNAQKDDSGEYECTADNRVGDPASTTITVEIVSAPKVMTEPESGLLVVKEGEPIAIGCKATGDPAPVVTLKKPSADKMMKMHDGNKLHIAKASLMDAGAYECVANNSLGISSTALIRVQVLYAPKVQMSHSKIHAREGVRVNITCVAEGEPSPTVTWKKEGNPLVLANDHHRQKGHSHTLLFHHLKEEDFGMYECTASNPLSSASGSTLLIGTPQVPSFTSKPHGTQGTKYTIAWTVNSHTPIDEYSLMYRKVGHDEWQTQSVHSTPTAEEEGMRTQVFQLSELEPATEYKAVVKARNKFGWSEQSDSLVFTTKNEEKYSDNLSSRSCILSVSLSTMFLLLALCTQYHH